MRKINAYYHTRLWKEHIAWLLEEQGMDFETWIKDGEIEIFCSD